MLLALFCILLFAPCLVALFSDELGRSTSDAEWSATRRTLPRWHRANISGHTVGEQEVSLAEDFVIRSFPKGLSQRRVLVQDFSESVRETIAQVRQALAEAARAVSHPSQGIRETKAELLVRLADHARRTLAQQIVRDGRRSRVADEKYTQACARLRWSEASTEPQWAEAFVAERTELVAA